MDDYVIPLLIVREVGTLLGKTRFQKLACVLAAESRRRGLELPGLNFEVYLHGPYSRDLAKTVEELVKDGLLDEDVHTTPAGNLQYVYTLPPQGGELIENFISRGLVTQALIDTTRDVVNEAAYTPLQQLIERAYQAYDEFQNR